jgi:lipopolysaccharide assembly outer membrane protein LptD (OstA)
LKLINKSILLVTVILLALCAGKAKAFSSFYFQEVVKQDTNTKDSLKYKGTVKGGLDQKVEYKARDSVRMSKDSSIVYFYGAARVIYGDFQLDADYIRYDKNQNSIFASGSINPKTKKYIGRPIFKSGTDGAVTADSLY